MNTVQKTSIAGTGGIAVAFTFFKAYFADVPIEDFVMHAQTLTIEQMLEIVMPLVLGTWGLIYDEDKE